MAQRTLSFRAGLETPSPEASSGCSLPPCLPLRGLQPTRATCLLNIHGLFKQLEIQQLLRGEDGRESTAQHRPQGWTASRRRLSSSQKALLPQPPSSSQWRASSRLTRGVCTAHTAGPHQPALPATFQVLLPRGPHLLREPRFPLSHVLSELKDVSTQFILTGTVLPISVYTE